MMRTSDKRFVIYANGHRAPDMYARSYVPVFFTAHEARAWLDRMIDGKDYARAGNTLILTHLGYTLKSEQLDEILAAPVANEPLRADYARDILRFKYGTWDEAHVKHEPTSDDATGERAPRPVREPRPDRPDAFVTITELCSTWDVPARIARAALRASGRIKPAYGWAFAQHEIADIKKLVCTG